MAGFECTSHRRSDGTRVDILGQTRHAENAAADFGLMQSIGITTVREGLLWHKIEANRGYRDWTCFEQIRDAAERTGTEIIWDLLHFGFPDWINPFHPEFPAIFADFAADFVKRNGPGGIYVPVNEISFLAWAAGDVEYMYPYSTGRGPDLKRALCAASVAAIRAIREIDPGAMIIAVDPMIAVHPGANMDERGEAERFHNAQFEALDMLLGRTAPELGGHAGMIDTIGLNHYPQSQWTLGKGAVDWQSDRWIRPSILMQEYFARYAKPILIAETGCEGDDRPAWFDHITGECEVAALAGVPILGLCLYPILSHHAWTGERHCPNGLFDGTTERRDVFLPLLDSICQYNEIRHAASEFCLATSAGKNAKHSSSRLAG
jgi:hypothetical protein